MSDTGVKQLVLELVASLLALEEVSITSDFFLSGGDSLTGSIFASSINAKYGVALELTDLYEHSKISAIISIIEEKMSS